MKTRMITRRDGLSLVELLVVLGIASLVMLALLSMGTSMQKQQQQSNTTFHVDNLRRNLVTVLNSAKAWDATIRAPANARNASPSSGLDCLVSPGTPCTADGGNSVTNPITDAPINVVLYANNEVLYDTRNPASGFTPAGAPCSAFVAPPAEGNPACPLRYDIKWTAICSPTSCRVPQVSIKVQAVYNPGNAASRVALNTANYSSTFIQGSSGDSCWVHMGSDLYETCATAVGMGTDEPARTLDIRGNAPVLSLSSADAGGGAAIEMFSARGGPQEVMGSGNPSGNNRGWMMAVNGSTFADPARRENLEMNYWNGGAWGHGVTLGSNGHVGIGTATPNAKLDVAGDMRIGGGGAACTAANEGSIRYNNASKSFEGCNGTAWSDLGGVPKGTLCGLHVGGNSSLVSIPCQSANMGFGECPPGYSHHASVSTLNIPTNDDAGSTLWTMTYATCVKN